MTNKPLKREATHLYHYRGGERVMGKNPNMSGRHHGLFGDCTYIRGDVTGLYGDCTGLWGDCTGLHGYCSNLAGDLNLITHEQREENSDISAWVEGE